MKKQNFSPESGSAASCDWRHPDKPRKTDNRNRIYRFADYMWKGVTSESYKPETGDWAAIARHVLVGGKGETPLFQLRYFEIAPGGFSSYEQHGHEHVVVCIRGKGAVRIGKKKHMIGHLDTVYISPDSPHQLLNPYEEPFGFLCIVNAERDRPRPVGKKKK